MSAFNLSIWRGELGREEEGEEGRVKYMCAVQLCAGVHITLNLLKSSYLALDHYCGKVEIRKKNFSCSFPVHEKPKVNLHI